MPVGLGIIGNPDEYSLSQTDEMDNGTTATGVTAALLITAGDLNRVDLVMEIRAQTLTEDWQYARADSAAEADAGTWVTVPAGTLAVIPLVRGDQKLYVKYASVTDTLEWVAFGFSSSHARTKAKSDALVDSNSEFDSSH